MRVTGFEHFGLPQKMEELLASVQSERTLEVSSYCSLQLSICLSKKVADSKLKDSRTQVAKGSANKGDKGREADISIDINKGLAG